MAKYLKILWSLTYNACLFLISTELQKNRMN